MKKVFTLALVVAMTLCVSATFAQKMGSIHFQTIVMAMPETKVMQTNLENFRKELSDNLETMQVEFNTKFAEYQKSSATMTEAIRGMKEKELQDLQSRMQQFEQNAMQEMQKKQNELMTPIIKKAKDTVEEVAKAGSFTVVYDMSAGTIIYVDSATVIDLAPAVKAKLGIE